MGYFSRLDGSIREYVLSELESGHVVSIDEILDHFPMLDKTGSVTVLLVETIRNECLYPKEL